MFQRCIMGLVVTAIVALASSAFAATTLTANMTNAGEPGNIMPTLATGAPRPASFGLATFILNDAQTAMTMTATVNNIDVTGTQTADVNDNLTVAHIHANATVTGTQTAGVVWGFVGSPFNETAPNDMVLTPFASGVGGTFTGKWDVGEGNNTTLTAQLPNILTGHAYINFHTTQFGGGEIRGFLTVVPEPSTIVLFGLGLAAVLGRCALRRRSQ